MQRGAALWAAPLAALLLASMHTTGGATLRLQSAPARHLRNQHNQERATELYNAYRSRMVTLPARPRKLIFTCNSAALCGGLGDRLKGLASTFVLAVLTDAEFMVDWEEPVRDPMHQLMRMAALRAPPVFQSACKRPTSSASHGREEACN